MLGDAGLSDCSSYVCWLLFYQNELQVLMHKRFFLHSGYSCISTLSMTDRDAKSCCQLRTINGHEPEIRHMWKDGDGVVEADSEHTLVQVQI